MKVFNDLKTRGVNDILIAVTDGLKGMPEALAAVFPATTLQTCIVRLIRNSLDYASWKDRKALAAVIRPIYTAPSTEAAQAELDAFVDGPWGTAIPDRLFEDIVGDVIKLCFFSPLTNIQPRIRTQENSTIRDWVASNRAVNGLWEVIRSLARKVESKVIAETPCVSDQSVYNSMQVWRDGGV
ncbi:hypothetical protein R8510_04666 [Ralstonia chuxiongensis]|nr:hypothetical protein R8510_04666 [Ralstonia chuxiongensis]